MSWLYRPIKDGCMGPGDLHDPRMGLIDVALLNDVLDVFAENERRAAEKPE